MENNQTQQLQTINSNVPAINDAAMLAQVRMDVERFPHYRRIAQPVRLKWMAGQIQYLASISRIRDFDARENILMATALDEMICADRDMLELTLPEIADAFKNGVFGLYGEFYGLSAPNLFGYLNSFLASEKKREATAIVVKSKAEAYREKTAAEQEERQRKIQEEIAAAKRAGTFVPTGRVWFKPQTVNDAIGASAHRKMVREQAREILKTQ